MKVEDLMIGDLVHYSYPNSFVTKVIDVCSHGEEHFIRCKRDEKDNLYKQDQLEDFNVCILRPIPLTPELLEKNGFERENLITSYNHYIGIDNRVSLNDDFYYINSRNTWHVHVDSEDYCTIANCELTYVHELQHLFRLCKIDKEIII